MADSSDAMRELSRAAPTFRPIWGRRLRKVPPPQEAVAELVEHLGADAVVMDELVQVLEVAEGLLTAGSKEVTGLVVTGLLEDLLLLASYPDTSLDPSGLERVLPPRCSAAVVALNEKWTAVWHDCRERPARFSLSQYLEISDAQLRRTFRSTYRLMSDGRLVGLPDVLRWEAATRGTPR